ncbi:MAG: hypothetical protein V7632_4850, partial [Bradyrhizobium sp.]
TPATSAIRNHVGSLIVSMMMVLSSTALRTNCKLDNSIPDAQATTMSMI